MVPTRSSSPTAVSKSCSSCWTKAASFRYRPVLLKAGWRSVGPALRPPPPPKEVAEAGRKRGYVAADPLSSASFLLLSALATGAAAKNPASRLCADARSDSLVCASYDADFFSDRRRGGFGAAAASSSSSPTFGVLLLVWVPGTLRATLRPSPRSAVDTPNRGSSLLDWDAADDSDDLHPPPAEEAADPDLCDDLLLLLLLLFLGDGGGDDGAAVSGLADEERLPL